MEITILHRLKIRVFLIMFAQFYMLPKEAYLPIPAQNKGTCTKATYNT